MNKNIVYIFTILEAIEKIFLYKNGFENYETFYNANEQQVFNATLTLLVAIGEESKKIDENLKSKISGIEWKSIAGFRNELVHNYRGVNKKIVWNIINNELEPLKNACIKILKDLPLEKNKINKYLSSEYYKHLNYLKNEL